MLALRLAGEIVPREIARHKLSVMDRSAEGNEVTTRVLRTSRIFCFLGPIKAGNSMRSCELRFRGAIQGTAAVICIS